MKELTHLSLFSGIGGLDLAAEQAGFTTVGQCEFADYPTKVLEKHWPDVPRWRDIRTLTKENFYERTGRRTVDVISGGFPCQPFSVAGKQRGKEDDRFLWPEMVRVIKELRPTWVVGENVAGIIRMALDDVLSDLEAEGYTTRTFLIPACGVGAPHQRYRTAILGYAEHNGSSTPEITGGITETGSRSEKGKKAAGEFKGASQSGNNQNVAYANCADGEWCMAFDCKTGQPQFANGSKDVEYTDSTGCKKQYAAAISGGKRFPSGGRDTGNVSDTNDSKTTRHGEYSREVHTFAESEGLNIRSGAEWWSVEPNVGRVANGISCRVDRLKCLGNAVVPQQFYLIFKAISAIEKGN